MHQYEKCSLYLNHIYISIYLNHIFISPRLAAAPQTILVGGVYIRLALNITLFTSVIFVAVVLVVVIIASRKVVTRNTSDYLSRDRVFRTGLENSGKYYHPLLQGYIDCSCVCVCVCVIPKYPRVFVFSFGFLLIIIIVITIIIIVITIIIIIMIIIIITTIASVTPPHSLASPTGVVLPLYDICKRNSYVCMENRWKYEWMD